MERSEAEAIYAQGREAVVDVVLALSARLEAQDAQLGALAERVEELEQRLKRDSRNSSLSPSHDPPWLGKRGRSRGTGRKQGGQLGHVGQASPLPSHPRPLSAREATSVGTAKPVARSRLPNRGKPWRASVSDAVPRRTSGNFSECWADPGVWGLFRGPGDRPSLFELGALHRTHTRRGLRLTVELNDSR